MTQKLWHALAADSGSLNPDGIFTPLRALSPHKYRIVGDKWIPCDMFATLPYEQIATIYGIIAACSDHKFEIVTTSMERLVDFYAWVKYAYGEDRLFPAEGCRHEALFRLSGMKKNDGRWSKLAQPLLGYDQRWPLPNLRLVTCASTQAETDARTIALMQCPAASYGLILSPTEKIDLMYPESLLPDGPERCCNGYECGCRGMPIDPPLAYGYAQITVAGSNEPMYPDWVRSIRDDCQASRVPFRFEGWGRWCPVEMLPPNAGWQTCWLPQQPGVSQRWVATEDRYNNLLDGVTWDGEKEA